MSHSFLPSHMRSLRMAPSMPGTAINAVLFAVPCLNSTKEPLPPLKKKYKKQVLPENGVSNFPNP